MHKRMPEQLVILKYTRYLYYTCKNFITYVLSSMLFVAMSLQKCNLLSLELELPVS